MPRSRWMMTASLLVLATVTVSCAHTIIPEYIKSEHPYTRTFYADFQNVYNATREALGDMGWKIARASKPSVFEYDTTGFKGKSVLLFTKLRETRLVVGSRYARMNIFIRSQHGVSEMEIRYLTVSAFPVKTFHNYRNDAGVQRLFERIKARLSQKVGS